MKVSRASKTNYGPFSSQESTGAAAAIFKRYSGKRRLAVRLLEAVLRPLVWFSKPQDEVSLDEVRQILVFEPGSLGDMVMLMPFLRSLRLRFSGARLSLVCRTSGSKKGPDYAAIDQNSIETLLLDQGFVDELIPVVVPWLMHVSPWKRYNPFAWSWIGFARQLLRLRKRGFDLAFPGGRSDVRYNLVLWLVGARRRVGYGFAGGGFLLTDIVSPDMARPHQTELSLRLLEHLGVQTVRDGLLLNLSPDAEAFSAKFLRDRGIEDGDLVVGVHPGSRVATRQWGADRFEEVARRLTGDFGAKVIWFAEPRDSSNLPNGKNIIPAAFPLREFLAVLAHCEFLVCNESGPMHLAASVGVPAVAVFGSGFPEWFRPAGERHRIVIRRDVWCRPCADQCIWREPHCLRLIPVEQVMEAVAETLKGLRQMSISALADK
jgi:ADP-heptose:LPS heptosyltransferase